LPSAILSPQPGRINLHCNTKAKICISAGHALLKHRSRDEAINGFYLACKLIVGRSVQMNPNEIQDADYPQIWNRPPSGPGTGSGPAQGPTNPTSPERRHTRADSNPAVVVFDATHTRPDTFHGLAGQPPAQSFTNQPQSYTQAPIQQPLLPQAGPGRQAKSDHSIDMDTLGALPGQRPDNQMYVQPDQTPVTARTRRINYGVRTPLKTETSYVAVALVILYLVALGFYLYVRVMYSMDMSPYIKGWVPCSFITTLPVYMALELRSSLMMML
jgi:hypothetical protein